MALLTKHPPLAQKLFDATRAFLAALILLLASFLEFGPARGAETAAAPEHEVKAVFLLNFAKYVEWPENAFAQTNSPVVVGLVGESKVNQALQIVIVGRTVNGRELVAKTIKEGEPLGPVHILFLSSAAQDRAAEVIRTLPPGVLTVGESETFLDRGGIINLAVRQEKVAMEINLDAATGAGVKISPKLLSLAKVKRGKAR